MTNSVVVVTPLHRTPLTPQERFSLEQLRRHLGKYRRVVVAPPGVALDEFPDFEILRLPRRYFASAHGYNRLLVTRRFYRAFENFEWLLLYQLDCLVFRDELPHWCDMPYDYVGAPILVPVYWGPRHALNGGFSLRRVKLFQRVLSGGSPDRLRVASEGMIFMQRRPILRALKRMLLWLHLKGVINAVPVITFRSGCPEDLFWSDFAHLLDPSFTLAPKEVASRFAFETEPARLYQESGGNLPFGCHAWEKHDPKFWEKILREQNILTN